MKRCIFVMLALLIIAGIIGWAVVHINTMGDSINDGDEKSLSGLNSLYHLTVGVDYEMFQANFGDVVSEDFYNELADLYEANGDGTSEVCLLHTLENGTRVLLVLEMEDGYWSQFSIKTIEILD